MHALESLPCGEALSPGPGHVVERRSFFGVVAAACAAAHLPGAAASWRCRQAPDDWTIEQFVREVTPVCRDLLQDTSARGQDRYLRTLAAYAARLGPVPVPEAREVGPGHRIGSNHGPEPFTVLHWLLEPGAVIAPHTHTYGNVVTVGLSGDALIHNYEVVGARDYDAKDPFEVVRVQEQVLRPGDVNFVSLERHYVHGFVAGPQGASGLDLTTRVAPKRPAPQLEVERAIDAARRTFVARWRQGA